MLVSSHDESTERGKCQFTVAGGQPFYSCFLESGGFFMKWVKYIILILILVFVFENVHQPSDSDVKMKTVEKETTENINMSNMEKQNNQAIRRFLQLDPTQYEDIVYYKQQDTMKSDELVIVKFKSHDQQDSFRKSMDEHTQNQKNIYEGYAPKQAEKLKNSICHVQANYGIYVVSNKAKEMDSQFTESLK